VFAISELVSQELIDEPSILIPMQSIIPQHNSKLILKTTDAICLAADLPSRWLSVLLAKSVFKASAISAGLPHVAIIASDAMRLEPF